MCSKKKSPSSDSSQRGNWSRPASPIKEAATGPRSRRRQASPPSQQPVEPPSQPKVPPSQPVVAPSQPNAPPEQPQKPTGEHCPFCNVRREGLHKLVEHLSHNEEAKEALCKRCGKKFNSVMKKVECFKAYCLGGSFLCPFCNQRLRSNKLRKAHLKKYHQDEKIFVCAECGMVAEVDREQQHMRDEHGATSESQTVAAGNTASTSRLCRVQSETASVKSQESERSQGSQKSQESQKSPGSQESQKSLGSPRSLIIDEGGQSGSSSPKPAPPHEAEHQGSETSGIRRESPTLSQQSRGSRASHASSTGSGPTAKTQASANDPEELPYECAMCDAKFKCLEDRCKHYFEMSVELNYCGDCKPAAWEELQEDVHVPLPETKPLGCDICKRSYFSLPALKRHWMTHESDPNKDYKCSICKAKFTDTELFGLHYYHHIGFKQDSKSLKFGASIPCTTCDTNAELTFRTAELYVQHLREEHGKRKCYGCTIPGCTVRPKHTIALSRHVNDIHSRVEYLKCGWCAQLFQEQSDFHEHRELNHDVIHLCRICERNFKRKVGLDAHMKRKHKKLTKRGEKQKRK